MTALATAAGVQARRDEYTRTVEPARALAAETLTLERTKRAFADGHDRSETEDDIQRVEAAVQAGRKG